MPQTKFQMHMWGRLAACGGLVTRLIGDSNKSGKNLTNHHHFQLDITKSYVILRIICIHQQPAFLQQLMDLAIEAEAAQRQGQE
jgi:hypothetical protein